MKVSEGFELETSGHFYIFGVSLPYKGRHKSVRVSRKPKRRVEAFRGGHFFGGTMWIILTFILVVGIAYWLIHRKVSMEKAFEDMQKAFKRMIKNWKDKGII